MLKGLYFQLLDALLTVLFYTRRKNIYLLNRLKVCDDLTQCSAPGIGSSITSSLYARAQMFKQSVSANSAEVIR